jgi:transposase
VDVIVERCAGVDIGKDEVVACVRTPGPHGEGRHRETRTFASFTGQIEAMADWFAAEGVAEVVMEATGSYWKPVVRHEAPCDRGEVKGLPLWAVAAAC